MADRERQPESKRKSIEEVQRFVRNAARSRGWHVTGDTAFLKELEHGLQMTVNRYGYFLCPCRDGTGERRKDRDIICPCIYAEKDIEEYGQCFCGLFVSEEIAKSERTLDQIPERRPEELRMQ